MLKNLVRIPRTWIQQNMSHPFKLPGIAMFSNIQEVIDTIVILREKKDHTVLQSLEKVLRDSTDNAVSIAADISVAEVWIKDITDILLGKADKKGNRNTEEYKKKVTGKEIEKKLTEYVIGINRKMKYCSSFLRDTAKHIRTTLNNWRKYLFTCYDHTFLPNVNLELELSHSRMKRKHRKMTGLKNSHQFILTHGEHFSFCFDFYYSREEFVHILQSADYKKIKNKTKKERDKSRQRGKNRLTVKNLKKRLKEINEEWGS